MRDYGKVSPQFWIGTTGRSLRGDKDAQIVAMYLMTSPHANMIGVFYCPITYITNDTGIDLEGATKALARLSEGGFLTYDTPSEVVFVHQMAKFQIADQLSEKDNQVKAIAREYLKIAQIEIRRAFRGIYAAAFHLPEDKALGSPSKGPPKPRTGTGAGTGGKPLSGEPDDASPEIEVLRHLNQRAGSSYRCVETNLSLIRGRLEGATLEQVKAVIDAKVSEWAGKPEMEKYLRPETLFGARKFEQYIGQLGGVKAKQSGPWYASLGYGSADAAHQDGHSEVAA